MFARSGAIAGAALVGLAAASAFAADGTLQVEQGLQWFDGGGGGTAFNGNIGGGEFGVYDFHLTNASLTLVPMDAAAKVTTIVNGHGPFEFQTFCLEPNVNIDFNQVLEFTVSTSAQLVGGGTRDLSPATAYLFTKFYLNQGFSPAYAYSPLGVTRGNSARDLQAAIWFEEGVWGNPFNTLPANAQVYVLDADVQVASGGTWFALWGDTFPGDLGGVRALNIVHNGALQQDLLALFSEEPTQPPPPPEDECEDRFTGGGFLFDTPTGGQGTFAVAGGIKKGDFWGHLNYIDHDTGMHVKGKTVTAYTSTGPVSRHSEGTCTIDGVAGTYSLDITDNGEPGKNDVLTLVLSNGYSASGVIDGGNIQLHKPKCKKK
jgi:hypothetical protein